MTPSNKFSRISSALRAPSEKSATPAQSSKFTGLQNALSRVKSEQAKSSINAASARQANKGSRNSGQSPEGARNNFIKGLRERLSRAK